MIEIQKPFIEIKGLLLEGVDGAGKSTIKDEFNKITNFKWFVVDRGPGSLIAYSNLYNRKVKIDRYYILDLTLARLGFVLIYVDANEQILRQRIKEKAPGDRDILFSDIPIIKREYAKYLKRTKMKTIMLDTSKSTIEETIAELLIKLNAIGKNYYER